MPLTNPLPYRRWIELFCVDVIGLRRSTHRPARVVHVHATLRASTDARELNACGRELFSTRATKRDPRAHVQRLLGDARHAIFVRLP